MAGKSLLAVLGDAIAARIREAQAGSEQAVEAARRRARADIEARARAGDPAAIGLLGQLDAAAMRSPATAPVRTSAAPPAPAAVLPAAATLVAATSPRTSQPRVSALSDGFRGSNLVRSIVVAEALAPPLALRDS